MTLNTFSTVIHLIQICIALNVSNPASINFIEGYYNSMVNETTFLSNISGRDAPQDGPLRDIVYLGIDTSTFSVFASLAVIGMIMTIAFLMFNISFRHKKYYFFALSRPVK